MTFIVVHTRAMGTRKLPGGDLEVRYNNKCHARQFPCKPIAELGLNLFTPDGVPWHNHSPNRIKLP
jgi:hypothetical protein